MNMHSPAHAGELLAGWLDDQGASVTAFAAHIGISRVMLSRVLHGHAAVSADMDLRLAEALGTTPDTFADRLGHLDEGHFKGCEWSYCWMHFGPSRKRDFPYGSRPCAHARLGVQGAFNGR